MDKPTRWYSKQQEKAVAKAVGGKTVSNSGATKFAKGDVRCEDFLLECKTKMSATQSHAIKESWLKTIKKEAQAENKSNYAVVFNFAPRGENYYIIDEKQFKEYQQLLNESRGNEE